MLHNTGTGRFHPIFYTEAPLPGPDAPDKPIRHRSKGHHTTGFDTRAEADAYIPTLHHQLEVSSMGGVRTCLRPEDLMEWDGVEVPADTAFFVIVDDKTVTRAL